MKTLVVKFSITVGDETVESDEHEYDYPENSDDIVEGSTLECYEDALDAIEYDKIEWVLDTFSIRHEIISHK